MRPILSTVVLTALGGARTSSHDATRELDIKTIQNALELYYVDNGKYPTTSWAHSGEASWANLETYLGKLPVDPKGETGYAYHGQYTYSYFGHPSSSYCSGQAYFIVYNKENSNGTGSNDGVVLCNGTKYTYGNAFVVGVTPME